MTTLHEQARAEAERRYNWATMPERDRGRAFIGGFLAGHEAATRTRVVTTVAELDALRVGAILRDRDGLPLWLSPHSGWTAANGTVDIASTLVVEDGAPLTVLYDPEETP